MTCLRIQQALEGTSHLLTHSSDSGTLCRCHSHWLQLQSTVDCLVGLPDDLAAGVFTRLHLLSQTDLPMDLITLLD